MKSASYLSIALYLLSSAPSHAAFTVCDYQASPCDTAGDHYACSVVGWTGPQAPHFCSDVDKSDGPGRHEHRPAFDKGGAPGGRFSSVGTDNFDPWSSVNFCGDAEGRADEAARQKCAPARAVREGDFSEQLKFGSPGAVCIATGYYHCEGAGQ